MIKLDKIPKIPNWAIYAAAAGVVLIILKKPTVKGAAAAVGAGVVEGAAGVVSGLFDGIVKGTGAVIGLPNTNLDRCKTAIMNVENGQASLYCSAGVFAKWQYLSGRKRLTGQEFTMSDIFK